MVKIKLNQSQRKHQIYTGKNSMGGLMCIFNLHFQMRVFAAFAAHAAIFCRFVDADGGDAFAAKMQVHGKAGCRNQVQQHN